MRHLSIFFILFLPFLSCHDKSTQAIRNRKAASLLVGKKKLADSVVWKLSQTYDPYNGGLTYDADSLNPQFLVLHRDGTFREYDTINYSTGHWLVNKSRDRIAKVYAIQNGTEIPEEQQIPSFRYEIQTRNTDSLALTIQGRHGMLRLTYIRFHADTNMSSVIIDSLLTPVDTLLPKKE
ncbi:MAG: hypothetical protein R3D00_17440 [Bacteroidia bacterium]